VNKTGSWQSLHRLLRQEKSRGKQGVQLAIGEGLKIWIICTVQEAFGPGRRRFPARLGAILKKSPNRPGSGGVNLGAANNLLRSAGLCAWAEHDGRTVRKAFAKKRKENSPAGEPSLQIQRLDQGVIKDGGDESRADRATESPTDKGPVTTLRIPQNWKSPYFCKQLLSKFGRSIILRAGWLPPDRPEAEPGGLGASFRVGRVPATRPRPANGK
jgi:hypothetical protein